MAKKVLLVLAALLIVVLAAGPVLAWYDDYYDSGGYYNDPASYGSGYSSANSSNSSSGWYEPPEYNYANTSSVGNAGTANSYGGYDYDLAPRQTVTQPVLTSTHTQVTVNTGSYTSSEVVASWTESTSWREGYTSSYQSYDTPRQVVGVSYAGKNKITEYAWTRNTYRYESWTDVYQTTKYTKYSYTTVTNYVVYDRTIWSNGAVSDTYLTSRSVVGPTYYSVVSTPYVTRVPRSSSDLVSSTRLTDAVVEAIPPSNVVYDSVIADWDGPPEKVGFETTYRDENRNFKTSYFKETTAPWTEMKNWSDTSYSYTQVIKYWKELTWKLDQWEIWRIFTDTTYYRVPVYQTVTRYAVYTWPSGYSERVALGGYRFPNPGWWKTTSSASTREMFYSLGSNKSLADSRLMSDAGPVNKQPAHTITAWFEPNGTQAQVKVGETITAKAIASPGLEYVKFHPEAVYIDTNQFGAEFVVPPVLTQKSATEWAGSYLVDVPEGTWNIPVEAKWKDGTVVKTTAQLTVNGRAVWVVPVLLSVRP